MRMTHPYQMAFEMKTGNKCAPGAPALVLDPPLGTCYELFFVSIHSG
jgi:hypothetical protein